MDCDTALQHCWVEDLSNWRSGSGVVLAIQILKHSRWNRRLKSRPNHISIQLKHSTYKVICFIFLSSNLRVFLFINEASWYIIFANDIHWVNEAEKRVQNEIQLARFGESRLSISNPMFSVFSTFNQTEPHSTHFTATLIITSEKIFRITILYLHYPDCLTRHHEFETYS